MGKNKVIDAGKVNRTWEYSQNAREEGLLKQLKYIKWTNIDNKEESKVCQKK